MYERLGYIGKKKKIGVEVRGYLTSYRKMPSQLCSPEDFRKKIAGKGGEFSDIIEKNDADFGIPQGAPISDIIANFYLLDFDVKMNSYVNSCGGFYVRYSDDILMVVPGGADEGRKARDLVRDSIKKFGDRLQIKPSKCSLVSFYLSESQALSYEYVEGEKGKNGLEYLGFRFDGKSIYLRDSTLSSFYRKITHSMRHEVQSFISRYPGKDIDFLVRNFNIEELTKKFGRVEDFDSSKTCEDWTFWTYARRSSETFGKSGINIIRQIKRHKSIIKRRVLKEFEKSVRPARSI